MKIKSKTYEWDIDQIRYALGLPSVENKKSKAKLPKISIPTNHGIIHGVQIDRDVDKIKMKITRFSKGFPEHIKDKIIEDTNGIIIMKFQHSFLNLQETL